MKTQFLWKTYNKIFCLKELFRAIKWGQLPGEQLLGGWLPWSNYPGSNYLGANCPGVIFLEVIAWGAIVRGATVLEPKLLNLNVIYEQQKRFINLGKKNFWEIS